MKTAKVVAWARGDQGHDVRVDRVGTTAHDQIGAYRQVEPWQGLPEWALLWWQSLLAAGGVR